MLAQNAHAAALGLTVAAFVHSAFNAALAGWLVRAFNPRARGAVLGLPTPLFAREESASPKVSRQRTHMGGAGAR